MQPLLGALITANGDKVSCGCSEPSWTLDARSVVSGESRYSPTDLLGMAGQGLVCLLVGVVVGQMQGHSRAEPGA